MERPNGWIEIRLPKQSRVTHLTAVCLRCGDKERLALDLRQPDGDVVAIVQSFERRHVSCPPKGVGQA